MSLLTSYNVDQAPIFSYVNGRLYVVNDFERMQVWDGLYSSLRAAGIAAPAAAPTAPTTAAGNCTAGVHLIRFRYLDSTSPASTYRSNASSALSYTVVAGAQSLSFDITDSGGGGRIIRSADTKVTQIQLEMTLAAGSVFYVVTTVANSATTINANITDANLALNDLAATYDTNAAGVDAGVGHEQPPISAIITQCKDYVFLGGYHPRTKTVGVTNASASVTGTGFSTLWAGRMLRIAGDAVSYQISSATTTVITLTTTYAGTTNAAAVATIFSKTPNRIYWSAFAGGAQLPESYKALSRARDCLNGTGDRLLGMTNWQGDLLLCGLYSMDRLIFTNDPAAGEMQAIAGRFGTWNQRCLIQVNQTLFGWGPNGAWMMKGGGPSWISKPIDDTIVATTGGYLDRAQMQSDAHGVYDPVSKSVRWFFTKTGETAPRETMAYDLEGQRWSRDQFRQKINSSINATDADGRYLAVLSDDANTITYYHYGATDGVPSTSSGAYTITAGSTTTVLNVSDSLPTGTAIGSNLTGLILYRVTGAEEKVISSNTSSTITVAALSSAPAAGESVYVGAIPCSIITDWWDGGDMADKKQAHLHVYFIPSTAGSLRIKLYKDYETSPLTFTKKDSTIQRNGLTITDGNAYCDVSISSTDNARGFTSIPMFCDWSSALKAEVICLSPAGTMKILDVRFDVNDERMTKKVVNQ